MRWISFLLAFTSLVIAGEALQTDWSGGVCSESVVTGWEDSFAGSQDVSSAAIPGQICLASIPYSSFLEEEVNSDLPLAGMDAGDLDGDGFVDLVGASVVTDHVTWLRNMGNGSWSSIPLTGSFQGALGCCISDVDGDGYPDVVGGMEEPDMVVLWKNTSGNGPDGDPVVVDSLFPGVHGVIGSDIDGDGMMDIMAAGNQCNQIAVWYNHGSDTFEKFVIDSTFTGTQSVSTGDFDGDGDLDAVGAALGLGEFAWWENPGNRTDPWQKHLVASGMIAAHHVVAVDINKDGLTDVLGSSFGLKRITWWENDGSTPPAWEPHTVASGLTGVLTAIPADFDGDGDMDIAGAGWVLDRVMWYENTDGTGENWQPRTVATGFNGAWPLASGDFSSNGRLQLAAGADVLTGPGTSHGVSIYDLCGFSDDGYLISTIFDTAEDPQWSSFQFLGEKPPGTSLEFYWKSSNDSANMGDWIGPFSYWSELSGDIYRYVQYKVEMSTTDSLSSPILHDISFYWDPSGISDSGDNSSPLVLCLENPASSGSVFLSVAEKCSSLQVEIVLSNIAGRIIDSYPAAEAGVTVTFDQLPAGAYLIKATSGCQESTCKVLVLN